MSENIHHDNPLKCEFCTNFILNNSNWRLNWKCYHRQIMTSEYREQLEVEYNELKTELDVSIDVLKKESKLRVIAHDQIEAKADPFSIDYAPSNLEESTTFQDLLVDECLLREIDKVNLTREEMQEKLRESLKLGVSNLTEGREA